MWDRYIFLSLFIYKLHQNIIQLKKSWCSPTMFMQKVKEIVFIFNIIIMFGIVIKLNVIRFVIAAKPNIFRF